MEKELKVRVAGKLHLPYTALRGIQGSLKEMSKSRFESLKKTLIDDGITFVWHVWREPGNADSPWYIIDGHGRTLTVKHLVEVDGYKCPDLPCAEIYAETYQQAKKLVLNSSAVYNQITQQGLYEYVTDLDMPLDNLEDYELPGIDWDAFRAEYFEEKKEESVPEQRTKEEYINASIKPVTLYYSAQDYPRIIEGLDKLLGGREGADYSNVVWELVFEKLQSTAS